MYYEKKLKKLIQLKRRRVFICDCRTLWHDNFLGDYKKSVVASSVEEREYFKYHTKIDYSIYQDMCTKLRQIKNRIWVIEKQMMKNTKE